MATQTRAARATARAARASGSTRRGCRRRGEVHWNLVAPALVEAAVRRGEGELADMGPFVRRHGAAHGPLPERQVRREGAGDGSRRRLGQGQPALRSPRSSTSCCDDVRAYLNGRDELFVQDLYCGADPKYRLSRALRDRRTRGTWRSCATCSSARTPPSCATFDPNFTVLHAPEFQADPGEHGTRTGTFIVLNLARRMILIGGTRYAGELKKSMFTVMNYLPAEAGRALDALLGEHRRERRHGALLRPLRHRQDDPLRRPGALAHRRRRARLVERTASSTSKAGATRR